MENLNQRNGKVIIVGNQKGGTGKSLVTTLLANTLHQLDETIKVLVVDLDDLQETLYSKRLQELSEPKTKEKLEKNNLSAYCILTMNSQDFTDEKHAELCSEYDFIFLDMPGNLKQEGVMGAYLFADYLFIPMGDSFADLDSSKKFIDFYLENVKVSRDSINLTTHVYGFFSRVKANESLFKQAYAKKDDLTYWRIPFFKNIIPDNTTSFKKEFSTIIPYKSKKKNDYEDFIEEAIQVILQ